MSEVSKNFKQEREEFNLTQQDAAILLGVSRITYIKWENEPDTMPLGKFDLLHREFERLRNLKEIEE